MKKILGPLIYFLLLALPLISRFGLYNAWELSKVLFFRIGVEIVLGFYLLGLIWGRRGIVSNRLFWPAALYVLVVFLTSLLGVSWSSSFWGLYFRQQGLLTLTHYFFFFFLISQAQALGLKPTKMVGALVSGGVVVSLGALWGVGEMSGQRLAGTLGEPNFLGGYLALVLPLSIYFWHKESGWRKKIFLLILPLLVATIIFTGSRSAILAVVIGLGLTVLFFFKKHWWRWGLVVGLVVVGGLVIFQASLSRGFSPDENRLKIWQKSVEAVKLRPFFGFGKENFELAFEKVLTEKDIGLKDLRIDRAHNEFLDILVESGLLGLGAYLWLLASGVKILWRKIQQEKDKFFWPAVFLSLVSFLVIGQLNVLSVAEYLFFWFLLGVAATALAGPAARQPRTVRCGAPRLASPAAGPRRFLPDLSAPRLSKVTRIFLSAAFILILLFLISLNLRSLWADFYFRQGEFKKAAQIYPWEEVYRAGLKNLNP